MNWLPDNLESIHWFSFLIYIKDISLKQSKLRIFQMSPTFWCIQLVIHSKRKGKAVSLLISHLFSYFQSCINHWFLRNPILLDYEQSLPFGKVRRVSPKKISEKKKLMLEHRGRSGNEALDSRCAAYGGSRLERKPAINSWKRHALCDLVLSCEGNRLEFDTL